MIDPTYATLKDTLTKIIPLNETVFEALTGKLKRYNKNSDVLVKEHEVADKLFFINEGYGIIKIRVNGQEMTRHIAKKGEFLTSLESFVLRTPSREIVIRTRQAAILYLAYNDLQVLKSTFSELDKLFNIYLQNSLIACQNRINDLLSLKADEYYEKLIRENLEITQAVPQYELASYLGIKPQSLSRIRNKLTTSLS